MKKTFASIAALAVMLALGDAYAIDWFGGRLSIGGGYGRVKPKLPASYQDSDQDGQLWTAHVKYFLNDSFSVVASYSDLEPQNRTTGLPIRFRPIIGSLRFNLFRHLPVTPYLIGGAGVSINKKDAPGAPSTKWDKLALQGGAGLEFFVNQGTSFGAEVLYHNFVAEDNKVPYRLVSLAGMVNIYFGQGPSTASAKEEAERAREESQRLAGEKAALEQQAAEAQRKAAEEASAKAEAEKKMQAAQAEIDNIKEMVARKDMSPVMFQTGSADLLVESHAVLDKVAETAKKYPDLRLRVEGHTDNQGSDAYNQRLSQRRADAVRSYLVHHDGLPPDHVVAVGFGKERPIAPNESPEGRTQNRRVEFIFLIK